MGKQGIFRRVLIGAFIALAGIGLIGTCIYSSVYCEKNNPWQVYYPGRVGTLGGLAYAISVTSIVSLCFFLIAFIFIIIINKFKLVTKILVIIGAIIWVTCFICEILFISWNDWDIEKVVNDDIKQFLDKAKVAYYDLDYKLYNDMAMFGIATMSKRSPPTFGKTLANVEENGIIVLKEINMPVCYFDNEDDKINYKPKECIGKWNGAKLKSYIKKLDRLINDDGKMHNWTDDKLDHYQFKWTKTNVVMYSYIGAYAIMPLFVGAQGGALIFGIAYLLLTLNCCGEISDENGDNNYN